MQFKANLLLVVAILSSVVYPASAKELVVDFEFKPPQWRTAICLPDDPYKSLVDEQGMLLYHYLRESGDFGTRVSVVVDENAKTVGQSLLSPRVPIVWTERETPSLRIVEEVFAVKKAGPKMSKDGFSAERKDRGKTERGWAKPAAGVTEDLSAVAVSFQKPIHYQIRVPQGCTPNIVVGLCEGWHDEPGRRILDISVEGAEPRQVDTVADLGKNKAGVFQFCAVDKNGDGLIDLKVSATDKATDKNAILNGFWVFQGKASGNQDESVVLSGRSDANAALVCYAGRSDADSRNDVVLVHVTNKGDSSQTITPKVLVRSAMKIDLPNDRQIQVDSHETVICTEQVASLNKEKKDNAEEATMLLAPLTIEPGKTASFAAVYCGGGRIEAVPATLDEAAQEGLQAIRFWKSAALPYDRIVVPDENIQALLDSSIRNIWQAREIKNGLPAFQVGATCYRSLFIVDGAFILEAANLVGAGKDTRAGIAYTLTFQKDDGRFEILPHYSKENGIVLWTCVRHAMLTQDKDWLRSIWPKLEKTVAFIKHLREESCKDKSPLNDGLMPPGYVDGGINCFDQCEYSNVYWNLVGLKAIIQAARWLEKNEEAAAWQTEYDDFYATFRKAAERDMKTDDHGNRCLPILMTIDEKIRQSDPDWYIYCKAQWTFCHGVYPGQLFEKYDPLVKGNLDNLATYEKEGVITTTGWLTGGIWNYFASFYGHAALWQGDGRKAAEVLYAFANHASPMLAWLEEQGLKNEPIRENGDMPHNWASAEFIRLAVHLLALDRGREMHLFEGLPSEWTKPGMVTKLDGIATPFGPLTCSVQVSDDGKSAALTVEPLSDPTCEKIVVHLGRWASDDPQAVQSLDPQKGHRVTIPIRR
jgi:hypothetical protein